MLHSDSSSGECLVYTYKEGMLSPLAHDLIIRVTTWSVDVNLERGTVEAAFDAGSLRVIDAAKDGVLAEGTLSAQAREEIDENIRKHVLETAKFSEVRFTGEKIEPVGDGFQFEGSLYLHGRARPITATSRAEGELQVIELQIHQPDFAIKPFKAMLGALKVKPDVLVKLSLHLG